MTVRLHNRDLEELVIEKTYPTDFLENSSREVAEHTYDGKLLGFKGSYHETFMQNIHIGYGNLVTDDNTELWFESDMESVELHFALCGDTNAKEFHSRYSFSFGYNHHNIIYAPGFRGKSLFPARADVKIFEINLSPSFITRFIPVDEERFVNFRRSIEEKKIAMLSPHNYPITPQMHLIIQDILDCDRVGFFKRMYLEAKVIELLMLQLEQIAAHPVEGSTTLKKGDVEKMHAVKEYITKHLSDSATLFNLAQQFCTNEYTLKKGFKEVFGTTIFSYWNEAKMEQAKKMLLEQDVTISEVSDKIGYKNPQHFSTAFKRKFGIVPSKLRC